MPKMLFALSLGFAGLILATQAGFAAPQCGPRDQVAASLANTYGESRQGMGMAPNSAVVEVFAALDTGTWTITATMPDGTMCLLASGNGYRVLSEPQPARGDPA